MHPASGALAWQLNGVAVRYSIAADGDQRQPDLRARFAAAHCGDRCVVVPRQVHGTLVVDAETATATELALADGVVSCNPQLALGAYGADCPGVVIAAPDCLAVAHCGWRGTAHGLPIVLAHAVAARSKHPREQWHALIGPGISGPCYEVDGPVLSARAWPVEALTPSPTAGHAQLDLATTLAHDLAAAGLTSIHRTSICTATDARLHSFRRRGPGLVQMLVAFRV